MNITAAALLQRGYSGKARYGPVFQVQYQGTRTVAQGGSKPRHGDSSRRGTCWTCAASSLAQLELSHFSNFRAERRENIPPRLPPLFAQSLPIFAISPSPFCAIHFIFSVFSNSRFLVAETQ